MRRLMLGPGRGLTLVELLVVIAVAGLLVVSAVPSFSDYTTNSRLREAGVALQAEALAARSEAIKRNRVVRLAVAGSDVRVLEAQDAANPVLLRQRTLPSGAGAGAATVEFSPRGHTVDRSAVPSVDYVAAALDVSLPGVTCSADARCPGLRIDGGGGIRLCPNKLSSCS
jgi:type IV fimbrial biogenesis protein FimT